MKFIRNLFDIFINFTAVGRENAIGIQVNFSSDFHHHVQLEPCSFFLSLHMAPFLIHRLLENE
jgi:hypothetical protein